MTITPLYTLMTSFFPASSSQVLFILSVSQGEPRYLDVHGDFPRSKLDAPNQMMEFNKGFMTLS